MGLTRRCGVRGESMWMIKGFPQTCLPVSGAEDEADALLALTEMRSQGGVRERDPRGHGSPFRGGSLLLVNHTCLRVPRVSA